MEGITDDHERGGAAGVTSQSCPVWQCRQSTSFSSRKKESTPAKQCAEGGRRRQGPQRFGQEREQRHSEQGADRVADQPRDQPQPNAVAEKEKHRSRREAADAAKDAEAELPPPTPARGIILR
jgi:hypothetical protein